MSQRVCLQKLLLICFLILISFESFSDGIKINTNRIRLNKDEHSNQIFLNLSLSSAESFSIEVRQRSEPLQTQTEYFHLYTDEQLGQHRDSIKLALSLPYTNSSSGRVNRNKVTPANNIFTVCAEKPPTSDADLMPVCKPLNIEVIDTSSAVPGFVYTNTLEIIISQEGKEQLIQEVEVYYKKNGFPLGIHSYKKDMALTESNRYLDSSKLCVYSPYSFAFNGFAVSLEGTPQGSTFLLGHTRIPGAVIPYHASISLNDKPTREVHPGEWVLNGKLIQAKDEHLCNGSNLEVTTFARPQDLEQARPGSYEGTLTVRVRAK